MEIEQQQKVLVAEQECSILEDDEDEEEGLLGNPGSPGGSYQNSLMNKNRQGRVASYADPILLQRQLNKAAHQHGLHASRCKAVMFATACLVVLLSLHHHRHNPQNKVLQYTRDNSKISSLDLLKDVSAIDSHLDSETVLTPLLPVSEAQKERIPLPPKDDEIPTRRPPYDGPTEKYESTESSQEVLSQEEISSVELPNEEEVSQEEESLTSASQPIESSTPETNKQDQSTIVVIPKDIPPKEVLVDCGCPDTCTEVVLDQEIEGYTCRERIYFALRTSLSQRSACLAVSQEYPHNCGPACDPIRCDDFDDEGENTDDDLNDAIEEKALKRDEVISMENTIVDTESNWISAPDSKELPKKLVSPESPSIKGKLILDGKSSDSVSTPKVEEYETTHVTLPSKTNQQPDSAQPQTKKPEASATKQQPGSKAISDPNTNTDGHESYEEQENDEDLDQLPGFFETDDATENLITAEALQPQQNLQHCGFKDDDGGTVECNGFLLPCEDDNDCSSDMLFTQCLDECSSEV